MTKHSEDDDLKIVEKMFAERGYELVPFDKNKLRAGKTPDRKIVRQGTLVGFLEVKSPQKDNWLTDQLAKAPPMKITGGVRDDPTFNRIGRHVETAIAQFDVVNPSRRLPNVLVFINHEKYSDYEDLRAALTGVARTDTGETIPVAFRVANGKIKDGKHRIDLYIWYDVMTSRIQGYVFGQENADHFHVVCEMLGLDKTGVKNLMLTT